MNSLGEESHQQPVAQIAERILFSQSLEEKLEIFDCSSVSFSPEINRSPASTAKTPVPGRPGNLCFSTGKASLPGRDSPQLPATPHLVNDENRGILLHFFANHELLAAELMALALLKFPDAPLEFRRGLYQTLREEQRHTKWYIARMKECGVSFGDYPVNGFFWNAVADMETPLDYVSRLSLTFEQANLDYAGHYGKILETAGDGKSAAIMRQIYRDEICHVQYGLKWFRKWKAQNESDWEALKKTLTFPLSPSRAKGNRTAFNRDGRIAAGFDEEYVNQLSVFERSKGRTPNVFFFNPDAENHIAALPGAYQANKTTLSLIANLEILAAFTARRDDVLLMRKVPSLKHLAGMAEAGFILPEMEALSKGDQLSKDSLLRNRRIHSLRPWSFAPGLEESLGGLIPNSFADSPPALWSDRYRPLFSKAAQARFFPVEMGRPFICSSSGEINEHLSRLKSSGFPKALIKAPVSAAGRGLLTVSTDNPLFGKELRAVLRIIDKQESVLLEPLHDRVFDFSVQYSIANNGEITRLGMLRQLIDGKGNYLGSIAPLKFCQGLDTGLARFLMNKALPCYESDSELLSKIAEFTSSAGYAGPLGIDAYVYRDHSGSLQHRIMCEINPRYTMGRVALEIRRQVAPGRNLRFEIIHSKPEQRTRCHSFTRNKQGKIEEGSFILNETGPETRFEATITVAKKIRSLTE